MKKNKILKIIDYISLTAAIIISVVFAILESLNIHEFSLLGWLFGGLATHFITNGMIEDEIAKRNATVEKKLEELIGRFNNPLTYTLNQIDTTKMVLKEIDDIDAYLSERILQAEVSVYDFCWWDFSQSTQIIHRSEVTSKRLSVNIDDSIQKFCQNGEERIYKEIFSLHSKKNKEKLLNHINFGENYQCSYFDTSRYKFPKMQFVIIDDKEVIFASRFYRTHCVIRDPDIVGLMLNYFDQAWTLSKKIKTEDQTDDKLINALNEEMKKSN